MSAEPPIAFTRAHEARARQIAAAAGRSYIDWPDLYAAARQVPPNPANAPQPAPDCRTNPPPPSRRRPPRPLTPNQLRAARLLTQGHSTTAIANALDVDRHTLADWKRNPFFQQELRHLIDDPRPTTDN